MFIIEEASLTRARENKALKLLSSGFQRFTALANGRYHVMLATFWACLLRKTDVWKAYGAASIVYFLATVDATFIRKYELDVTEVGTEVDLVLSFISVVATEAWTVFL